MSSEGLLYVKGRFKSLLISSDGEKYSPEGIEETIAGQSPYIEQAMLYNNQSPYTIALIVPNKDAIARALARESMTLHTEEGRRAALSLLDTEMAKYRKGGMYEGMFPERWLPSCFSVLPEPFTEQNQMLNSTMKMVRGKIEKAYSSRIDALYTAEGRQLCSEDNLKSIAV